VSVFLDQTREKWVGWLDRIGDDLYDLAVCRHIFLELLAIIDADPTLGRTPSVYWHFLFLTYGDYAISAVRRQVKSGDEAISLARLLEQVSESPNALPLSRLQPKRGILPSWAEERAQEWAEGIANSFAPEGGAFPSRSIVRADLERLQAAAREIESVADRMVAHLDRRPPLERPQPADLHAVVDELFATFHRYYALVAEGKWDFNIPGSVGDDWKQLFTRPWIVTG
jgi:hypothetical protein